MKKKNKRLILPFLAVVGFALSSCENLEPGLRFNGLNAYAVANEVARVASVYGPDITGDSLMEKTSSYADEFSSRKPKDKVLANFNDLALLLHEAFADIMPEHVGARTFQGACTSLGQIVFDKPLTEQSKKAFEWLCSRGLFSSAGVFSPKNSIIDQVSLRRMMDRFHYYFGQSYVNDFFAMANHDYLYDECEIAEADPYSETRIYDSRLIPQAHINSWAKGFLNEAPAAKAFNDSFMDASAREGGNLAGLGPLLNSLLEAATIDDFVDILKREADETGYCPLWSSIEYTNETFSDEQGETTYHRCAVITSYTSTTYSGVYLEGQTEWDGEGDSYEISVARFTPIFQEALDIEKSEAEEWAKKYTHFKYLFCKAREEKERAEFVEDITGDSNIALGSTKLANFLTYIGIKDPTYVRWSDPYQAYALLSLFNQENLPYLKGFVIWQLFAHYSSCLPSGEAISKWAFSGRYSTDEEGLKNDRMWGSYCLPHISKSIANRFAQSPSYADQIDVFEKLLEDLKDALGERIDQEDWLSDEGKSAAKSKLETLAYSIGGTNSDGTFLTYEEPKFEAGASLYRNLSIEENSQFDQSMEMVGKDWREAEENSFFEFCQEQDPLTANAFYMPSANGIDIYLGYIAAYDDARTVDEETFLATFGRTLGHELSHAFDNNGMRFDGEGQYKPDFIPREDQIAFANRVAQVALSYQGYEVMPGRLTDSGYVVSEAVADVTGTTLCLDIAKEIPQFDYAKFFLLGAKDMGGYASQRTYEELLAQDAHPFGRARINTCFRLFDEFHEAYGTKEGDGMYLTPEERYKVW